MDIIDEWLRYSTVTASKASFWTAPSISLKKVLFTTIVVSGSVAGGCSDKKDNDGNDDDDDCWYQLWYFWLIIALFLVGVLLLIFIYCKQQAKQARLEHMGRTRTHMVLPPAYDEPGHLPPPYSVALAVTDTPQPAHFQHHLQRNCQGLPSRCAAAATAHPIRAESVPPPYSPPPINRAQEEPLQALSSDRLVNAAAADPSRSPLPSWSSTPQSEVAGPSHAPEGNSQHSVPTAAEGNTTNQPPGYVGQQGPPSYLPLAVHFPHSHDDTIHYRDPPTRHVFYHNPLQMGQSQLSREPAAFHTDGPVHTVPPPRLHNHSTGRRGLPHNSSTTGGSSSYAPCFTQYPPPRDTSVCNTTTSHNQSRPTLSAGTSSLSARLNANPNPDNLPSYVGTNHSTSRDSNRLVTTHSYNMSDSASNNDPSRDLNGRTGQGKIYNTNTVSTSLGTQNLTSMSYPDTSSTLASSNAPSTSSATLSFPGNAQRSRSSQVQAMGVRLSSKGTKRHDLSQMAQSTCTTQRASGNGENEPSSNENTQMNTHTSDQQDQGEPN